MKYYGAWRISIVEEGNEILFNCITNIFISFFHSDAVDKKLQTLLEGGANAYMKYEWLQPEFPSFFDEKKFLLGQQMFSNNTFTMMIGKLCGLLCLFAVPSIKDVLVFTRQSGTPCAAFRRYVSTILHTWVWYEKRPGIEKEYVNEKMKFHFI